MVRGCVLMRLRSGHKRSRPRPIGDDCSAEREEIAEEFEKMHVHCHYTSFANRSYYSSQRGPTMEKLREEKGPRFS